MTEIILDTRLDWDLAKLVSCVNSVIRPLHTASTTAMAGPTRFVFRTRQQVTFRKAGSLIWQDPCDVLLFCIDRIIEQQVSTKDETESSADGMFQVVQPSRPQRRNEPDSYDKVDATTRGRKIRCCGPVCPVTEDVGFII